MTGDARYLCGSWASCWLRYTPTMQLQYPTHNKLNGHHNQQRRSASGSVNEVESGRRALHPPQSSGGLRKRCKFLQRGMARSIGHRRIYRIFCWK